ncbi:hypothetical protein KVR01_005698 [Diaporthe batatas]|uniref:uncharacterized protein n=1 Tax=Diaporthe batatas TaxID=748121 RepID=UPI001D0491B4|nr:uncharacterized protein KVR01_005698 [Diaporthe batatas]KAG8165423.1 hypothetical protein KVR01_005698 [Diaporthe batatas]
MAPDATAGGETRSAPPATKRNSAVRKEQNRNASRIYRERRKQRLALLDHLLQKDVDQALSKSSQENNLTGPAPSQLEKEQPVSGLTDSGEEDAAQLAQTSALDPLSEDLGTLEPSALDGLSFDASWPIPSSDPVWDFVGNQDGVSDAVETHLEAPALAPSKPFMLGEMGREQWHSTEETPEPIQSLQDRDFSAAMKSVQANIFFTTPGQQHPLFFLESPTSGKSSHTKTDPSQVESPSFSSKISSTIVPSPRSAVSKPCSLPGEDSLGEFMQRLMNLRVPDVKQVIFVQQSQLFAAVMDNTLAIGVMTGPEAIFADEAASPFNRDWVASKGSMQLSQIRSKFSGAPRDLQPVDVQITVEHHVYLDVIPFPSFRDRALRAIAQEPPLLDEDELCRDICSNEGLIVWGSQGNSRGMEAARPWDMRSWEPKPWFLRKYHFLVGGWEDEMWRATRWWHMMRNERIPVG